MKHKCRALLLCLAILLSGCSAMLTRTVQEVQPHEYRPAASDDDPGVLKAQTYQELVSAVLYFVSHDTEEGVIRLINFPDVEDGLMRACQEVSKTDPLGAYAVDFIKYDYTRVVKYYEANISITYRRTPEQINSLVNVTGTSAIREELRGTLRTFSTESALRVDYFTEDASYISTLISQAYYNTPEAALGMPESTITLYPDNDKSTQRIVEILLSYPDDPAVLARKSQQLQRQADTLSLAFSGQHGQAAAEGIYSHLSRQVEVLPSPEPGKNTAYAALLEMQSDSEGLALAYQLLAQSIHLESLLVQGSLNGAPHFWNIIHLDNGDWRHVDASWEDGLLRTDSELEAAGYTWNRDEYPSCIDPAVEASLEAGLEEPVASAEKTEINP